ncbi:hypothetical protein [Acinetobacter sp. yr461]|uniref:hypothetical protein n=1 Tax=Acinetobacter sp. yr461 TaxID=1761742 RepID=UPI0008D65620|nr:hypothetical protein [Acinetobacter sp. yr461]SEO24959.1 hypothetical protein SAMN04487817_102144 [Acinetobacter sp. yr461]
MKLFIIVFIAIFSSIGLICLIALLRNLKKSSLSGEHDHSSSLTHHYSDSHHHSSSYSNDCSSSSDSGGCNGGGGGD